MKSYFKEDQNYFYRFQTKTSLLHMQRTCEENLAPSIWNQNNPHTKYIEIQKTLPESKSIYTLSVWKSEGDARYWFSQRRLSNTTYVLMRIPRSAVNETNLFCIDDDMTGRSNAPSPACLLYEVSCTSSDGVYGSARIPWSKIEMTEPYWYPLEITDEDDVSSVKNIYSATYNKKFCDLDHDNGIPQSECQIRRILRDLERTDAELKNLSFSKFLRRKELIAIRGSLLNQWSAIQFDTPSVSAAVSRLQSILPADHPWLPYFED